MNNYSYDGINRITKRTAEKLYNAGHDVLFCPSNLRPLTDWGLGIWQNKDLCGQYDSFTQLVNWFEWFNCTNETGRYTSFYAKEGVNL